ncbi:unnamed protein product [Lota lota]
MSSVPVNDENHGVHPGGKHNGPSDDLFAIELPTGRQSILRPTENLPNKTVAKGGKVCFQTPRRDPVSKRILSPSNSVKMESLDECMRAMNSLRQDSKYLLLRHVTVFVSPGLFPTDDSSYPDGEMPIKSKGGYQLDFDNLEAMDPFQGSDKLVLSPMWASLEDLPVSQSQPEDVLKEAGETESALDETLPFNPSVENSLVDVSTDVSSTERSVVTVMKNSSVGDQEPSTATPDKQPPAAVSLNVTQDDTPAPSAEDAPLPARGQPLPGNTPEASPVKKTDPQNVVDVPKEVKEPPIEAEAKPVATVAPISNDITTAPDSEATVEPAEPPAKGGPVKLEFNFDDGAKVKRKPPPKTFGKRPPSPKASGKKPALEKQLEPRKEQTVAAAGIEVDVDNPLPRVAYSFSFDMLDDPNFNPFGTSGKMDNQCGVKSSPAGKAPPAAEEMAEPEQTSQRAGQIPQQEEPMSIPAQDLGLKLEAERRTPEPVDLGQYDWNSQTLLVENSEEFVPGTTFISSDFDGQMDYLEQFGSTNFKESALRKQSLYLKFDPLLRESPKKAPAVNINPPRASALASRYGPPPTPSCCSHLITFLSNHTMLESLVPQTNTEEAIIDVLKYSQKDLDAAIARVKAEAKEKEELMTLKYEKLYEDDQEMRKIIFEFEQAIPKIMADREKEQAVAQAKLSEVLLEKEQMSMDLSALESSFSELFKRLEKYKGVLEGYKKNEETLKGCAQEYLLRIKKEEQRYKTLKAYAEEKITKANEEIGMVRSRLKAEVSGLQAQLRREQLKSQSLESNYDQKVKEAVELTSLCDELIAKVQKG